MKNKIIFILSLVLIISCKQEKKEQVDTNQKREPINFFNVKIDAVVKGDDTFTLFYLEGNEKNITRENSVSIKVKGGEASQNLEFQLKEDVLPTRLVLRLGGPEASDQKIVFNTIEVGYRNHKITVEKEKIFQFFNPNKFINYNQDTFTATPKEVDGKFRPNLFSRRILENKIDTTFF